MTIQSLAVPRTTRVEPAAALASLSADEVNEDDSFCQKSELAIRDAQTSNLLKRLY
jgi:hypothetical protein